MYGAIIQTAIKHDVVHRDVCDVIASSLLLSNIFIINNSNNKDNFVEIVWQVI